MHVLKLGFIALNDCCWINWPSWVEKMFKTNKFCRNLFDIRNSYPNRFGVSWGSPTPLHVHQSFWHSQYYGGVPLVKVCEVDGGTPNTMPLNVDSKLKPNSGVGVELILRPLTSQHEYTWLYVSIRWIMCQVDSNLPMVHYDLIIVMRTCPSSSGKKPNTRYRCLSYNHNYCLLDRKLFVL